MFEFIDKTTEQSGTPINREAMMAIQGFIASQTHIEVDGTVIYTNSRGETLTINPFNINGKRTIVFIGEKTITIETTLNKNGSISEELK